MRSIAVFVLFLGLWSSGTGIAAADPGGVDPLDMGAGSPSMREVTRAGADEPQCMGSAVGATPRDKTTAQELMAGRMTVPTFDAWTLPVDPTWGEDPFDNPYWEFQYHALRWVDPLRRVGLATNDQAMLNRYAELVRDWVENNPISAPPSAYSWNDMAVGVRSIALVCLSASLDVTPAWLNAAMQDHVNMLADPAEYRPRGNHGLHQNMGLLALGCHRDVDGWRRYAIRRADTMLRHAVDSEGVTDEGSIKYQGLNYRWWREMETRIELCGLQPSSLYVRVSRMPAFLAQATQPDGNLVAFGDTSAIDRAYLLPGTAAEYAATQGRTGRRPDRVFSIFRRGYAFSRTGWFDAQSARKQALASLRFGQARNSAVHGHEDGGNIGYFARGRQILWQPGVYGAGGGPPRRYVVSNESHNTVDIPETTYDRDAETRLKADRHTRTLDLVSVTNRVLKGVTWRRTMIHVKKPGFLVVDDRITQRSKRQVLQRWHFGSDRTVGVGRARAQTSGTGSDATVLWIGKKPRLSVVRGRKDPMLGWRSHAVHDFVPAPVVEASRTGRKVRMTAIIVPRGSNVRSSKVRLVDYKKKRGRLVAEVAIGRAVYRVAFTARNASVRRLR